MRISYSCKSVKIRAQISRQTWLIMKLIPIFLLITFLQTSAKGISQTITINKSKVSLEEILLDINKQTGYSYSVNNQALQKAKLIDISVRNASIDETLSLCLKDQPLSY